MKKIIYLLSALLFAASVSAQLSSNRCATHDVMLHKEQQNPGYLQRVNACFDAAKELAEQQRNSRSTNDTIYRVQVVFHIVYTSAAENIPDSIIYSQLEVLNEDYRRRNADTGRTRSFFKNVAADPGIEFYIATVDPDGNPTTGITRTQGNPGFLGFNPFSDNVKKTATGGIDPWPTDRYVNIWVCNILNGLGILGYAFPPDNAPNWPTGSATDSASQGVVLHFPVAGRNYPTPIDPTVTKGRSLVHEMGHYLGLRHIWGDGDCTEDDGLSDTPNSSAANQQSCDTTINSCSDSPTDFPDMLENYMDYSDDRCQNMFTEQQVGIMRAMLQTSRAGIATVVVETGIETVSGNFEKVSIFPSPSTGMVQLQVEMKRGEYYSYEVLSTIGEKLIGETDVAAGGAPHFIDLSNQPAGIYFAKIVSGGQAVVKKFQIVR